MMMPVPGAKARICLHASMPLTPGIFTSSNTGSNGRCLTAPTASAPVPASSTLNPLAASEARMVFRKAGSSSTTRTLHGCANVITQHAHFRELAILSGIS
jgi:hypothetical protein